MFTYRADGLRATENTGTDKTYYLYDGGNAVCRLDSSGNVNRTYVYAPDGLVGWTGSGTRYFLFDWQGNLEHSMESSTTLKASYAFNAWGQRNSIFPINAESSSNDRFGYNARWGYVKDLGTGMYYCQNRYYGPANGRWLTRDPIGYAGGVNVYGYCGSGPVGAMDSRGFDKLLIVKNKGGLGMGSHLIIGVEDTWGHKTFYGFYPSEGGDRSSSGSSNNGGSSESSGSSGGSSGSNGRGRGYVKIGDKPNSTDVKERDISQEERRKLQARIFRSAQAHLAGDGRAYDLVDYNCATWATAMIEQGLEGSSILENLVLPDFRRKGKIITPKEVFDAFQ